MPKPSSISMTARAIASPSRSRPAAAAIGRETDFYIGAGGQVVEEQSGTVTTAADTLNHAIEDSTGPVAAAGSHTQITITGETPESVQLNGLWQQDGTYNDQPAYVHSDATTGDYFALVWDETGGDDHAG